MNDTSDVDLQTSAQDIRTVLERHRLLENLARQQPTEKAGLLESLQHRQNLVELERRLAVLHPADVAHLLDSLPAEDRRLVWTQLSPGLAGQALVEVSVEVRDALVAETPRERLLALLRELDADDLRYLADSVPPDVVAEVASALDQTDRRWLEQVQAYEEDSAARLMMQDELSLRDAFTVGDAIALIRQRGSLPAQTDRLFVVDSRNVLIGAVGLGVLLVADGSSPVTRVMDASVRSFRPSDQASTVAKAFERYDLLSAPVVDDRGKLVGRVTADAVVDFIRTSSANEALALAGLRKAEDVFAPAVDSARNRWPWLAVNLATAFVASRVIGAFEHAIHQLVALATLMPIVASIGGNTGNQTVALVVRGIAVDQIRPGAEWHLLRKELTVSLLNGAVWGTLVGAFATAVYHSLPLGLVMAAAVLLNLVIAAVVGVVVPIALSRLDRDPAQGSSVVLTFVTDSMGFFLFLGLASAFLVGG
jgi:magnesium transporter